MAWRNDPAPTGGAVLPTIVIECLSPVLDGGRYAVKRVVGEEIEIAADIFKDGHDLLSARVLYRRPRRREWLSTPLSYVFDDDRWYAKLMADEAGTWHFMVEAWTDAFGTWRGGLVKKADAGQDVSSELLEGSEIVHEAARHARGAERHALDRAAQLLGDAGAPAAERVAAATDSGLQALVDSFGARVGLTRTREEIPIRVDPPDAAFAAWYELFPRSTAVEPGRHGTFRNASLALSRVSRMGFDVVYLPPIHPVGHAHRKGPNNTLNAAPNDPGSPWAIGNEDGGHDAVNPELGTLADFREFVAEARRLGLEVALDYALQCSPDHPWVKQHPDWFFVRPDGTIKYAENPPKKYEDIYPINFWCDDREGLWNACRDLLLFWIGQGVRTFRVDNPHTKPFAFWEWVIAEVHRQHPGVIFLSEAFTRPKRMKNLAKLGFTQSYTYFTWRNTAAELEEYVTELAGTEMSEYLRGNFFVNTPDILHEFLQHGGRPAFRIRLLLAATLLPLYGIYSGYELSENAPLHEGSEEYLDSEKYQIRQRDWDAPGNLSGEITRLNVVRRENRALQLYDNIAFHPTGNPHVLCYSKVSFGNDILVAVSTDPRAPQEAELELPLAHLGIAPGEGLEVEALLSGERERWEGPLRKVVFEPEGQVGEIWRIIRRPTTEAGG